MKLKTRKRIEHVWKESPDDALNHAAVAAMKRTGAASLEIKFHDDGWYVAAVPRLWLARAIAMRRDIGTAHLSNVVEGGHHQQGSPLREFHQLHSRRGA